VTRGSSKRGGTGAPDREGCRVCAVDEADEVLQLINKVTYPTSDPGKRCASGTPLSRRIDPLGARSLGIRKPGGRPHFAPRSSYCGGTPGSAILTGVGRPPPAAAPPEPPVACPQVVRCGYPGERILYGSGVPPVFLRRGYPRERILYGAGCALRSARLLLLPVFAACTGGGPGRPRRVQRRLVQQALVAAVERSVPRW